MAAWILTASPFCYAPAMSTEPANKEILDRLGEISVHLRNLDRRDRRRAIWSWAKGAVGLAIFMSAIFGSWYFVGHLSEIMKLMAQESTRQSQQMIKSGSENFLEQIKNVLNPGGGESPPPRARTP